MGGKAILLAVLFGASTSAPAQEASPYKDVDVGEYGLIDARLAFALSSSAKTREISIWAHNLGNTIGVSSAFSGSFATANFTDYYLVAPRTIGVTLTVGF